MEATMAKCFMTGVELPFDQSYLLNIGVANRIVRDLRQQLKAMTGLLEQLGQADTVEIFNPSKRCMEERHHRRLVSYPVCIALQAAAPGEKLFISWGEWKGRKKEWRPLRLGEEGPPTEEIFSHEPEEESCYDTNHSRLSNNSGV